MKTTKFAAAALLAAALLSACDKEQAPSAASRQQPASAVVPTTADSSPQPVQTAQPVQVAQSAPASHNYALNQDGTYGYEPALSEDDIRSGKATKALVMMRYVGLKNGSYIVLVLDADNPNMVNRVSCQAPCAFAKSEVLAGDVVIKTETLRVAPDSLIGAMIEDAMAGQLKPFGQQVGALRQPAEVDTASPASQASPVPDVAASSGQPVADAPDDGGALQQTSFDCSKAKSISEYLVCHDPALAAADRDLASVYQQAKNAVTDQVAFAARVRKQWNFREKNCRDKACLVSWYAYQTRVLTKIAQTGDVDAQDN